MLSSMRSSALLGLHICTYTYIHTAHTLAHVHNTCYPICAQHTEGLRPKPQDRRAGQHVISEAPRSASCQDPSCPSMSFRNGCKEQQRQVGGQEMI